VEKKSAKLTIAMADEQRSLDEVLVEMRLCFSIVVTPVDCGCIYVLEIGMNVPLNPEACPHYPRPHPCSFLGGELLDVWQTKRPKTVVYQYH
jgi:hypothetical protein